MRRIGVGFLGDLPVREVAKLAQKAERSAFDSVWISEDYFKRDAISCLAGIALSTKTVKIGSAVINPFTRHVGLIATTFATLDELSNGRAILGIGSGNRFLLEKGMGLRTNNPIEAMRESVLAVKKLIAGEKVLHLGKKVKMQGVSLDFKPIRSCISVYLAAIGPRMLQLAGEIGDGVFLTAGSTQEYVQRSVRMIERGALRGGRSLSDLEIAAYIIWSVSRNRDAAKKAAKRQLVLELSPPEHGEHLLEIMGFNRNVMRPIRTSVAKGDLLKASQFISNSMVTSMTISGTPTECYRKLEEYVVSGITLPILLPVKGTYALTIKMMRDYICS